MFRTSASLKKPKTHIHKTQIQQSAPVGRAQAQPLYGGCMTAPLPGAIKDARLPPSCPFLTSHPDLSCCDHSCPFFFVLFITLLWNKGVVHFRLTTDSRFHIG
jgi:hypothetical protein